MAWRLQLWADLSVPALDRPIGAVWPTTYSGLKSDTAMGYRIVLPGGALWHTLQFMVDRQTRKPTNRRWAVTMPDGDPTRMTVAPSIDIFDGYHGFIRDGVISDDVSGKKFKED